MPIPRATQEATARFAGRFPGHAANAFFRQAQGLTVSSLGLGTYLGGMDDAASAGYQEAIAAALAGGINFLDTSLNYRNQRSERDLGAALAASGADRAEVVLCTKAGYLVPDAVPAGIDAADVVGRMHCMAPAFLDDQLSRSLANLRVSSIDVYYLHNPETQLGPLGEEEFYRRIGTAFAWLEEQCAAGRIQYYGAATWSGFRARQGEAGLSIEKMCSIAESIAGGAHRFRFIQLPFNLGMVEAMANGVLKIAADRGITVVASASLLQARLTKELPEEIRRRLPGGTTCAHTALQFARSAPGVTVALAGMGRAGHVAENLQIAGFAPAPAEQFQSLFP
jgi:aryl-alcohol dehydrogenase-like predicted oxidoreductase